MEDIFKSKRGGSRPNSGRKKGGKNKDSVCGTAKSRPVCFRVPEDVAEDFKKYCKLNGHSQASCFVMMVKRYVADF